MGQIQGIIEEVPSTWVGTVFTSSDFLPRVEHNSISTIDVAAKGTMNRKTATQTFKCFEDLVQNNYQAPSKRDEGRRHLGVLERDQLLALQAQLTTFSSHLTIRRPKCPTLGEIAFMQK